MFTFVKVTIGLNINAVNSLLPVHFPTRLFTIFIKNEKIYGIEIRNVIIVKKIEYFSSPIKLP